MPLPFPAAVVFGLAHVSINSRVAERSSEFVGVGTVFSSACVEVMASVFHQGPEMWGPELESGSIFAVHPVTGEVWCRVDGPIAWKFEVVLGPGAVSVHRDGKHPPWKAISRFRENAEKDCTHFLFRTTT